VYGELMNTCVGGAMRLGTVHFQLREWASGGAVALVCASLLLPGPPALAQQAATPEAQTAVVASPEKLESLVAPIALYPDALLAQTLVASTYPLEIVQLQQWLTKNPGLKDKALIDAVAKQPWDPSVQSMAAIPDVVKRLADDVQWTTELGNAFLAQQADVMDAVQRMRKKAVDKGALVPNEQQKVETKVVEEKTVIVVESKNPEVVYVPVYSPTVVYGPAVYAYPPIYYPPYTPGAAFVTFSFGVMVGAAWGGSCCSMGWGNSDVDINIDNNFNRINHNNIQNIDGGNRVNAGGKWQHDPQHRGGAPYADRTTADKYGGTARGDSLSTRQASAARQPGLDPASGAGSMNTLSDRGAGTSRSDPASSLDRGGMDRGAGLDPARGSAGEQRSHDLGASSRPTSGFSGGSGGYSGGSARASSSRGQASMGARGGGRRR
jgi:hypothetical protein